MSRAAAEPRRGRYHAGLFAYKHADWYVAAVLAKADQYRVADPLPASRDGPGGSVDPSSVTVPAVLHHPRIALTGLQRADVRSGVLDPRLLAAVARIAEHDRVVIRALVSVSVPCVSGVHAGA